MNQITSVQASAPNVQIDVDGLVSIPTERRGGNGPFNLQLAETLAIDIISAVEWRDRTWYYIEDDSTPPGHGWFYLCEIGKGSGKIYLTADDGNGRPGDGCELASDVIFSGTRRIVRQS